MSKLVTMVGSAMLVSALSGQDVIQKGKNNNTIDQNDYSVFTQKVIDETANTFCKLGVYFDKNNNSPYNVGWIAPAVNGLEVDVEARTFDIPLLGNKYFKKKYSNINSSNGTDLLNGQFPFVKQEVDKKMIEMGCGEFIEK